MANVFIGKKEYCNDIDFDTFPLFVENEKLIIYLTKDDVFLGDLFAMVVDDDFFYRNGKTIHELANLYGWEEI